VILKHFHSIKATGSIAVAGHTEANTALAPNSAPTTGPRDSCDTTNRITTANEVQAWRITHCSWREVACPLTGRRKAQFSSSSKNLQQQQCYAPKAVAANTTTNITGSAKHRSGVIVSRVKSWRK
jgi:hypothetical protein